MTLVRFLLVIVTYTSLFVGTKARAQYGGRSNPIQPKVVTAAEMPLVCFSIRVTNLYTYAGFQDTHYGKNFLTHVLPSGEGFTPVNPLTLTNNESKFIAGYVYNANFFAGDRNLIEIGINKPDMNHPDNSGRIRVELGPNLEFTDADAPHDATESIDYDHPFRHHLRLIPNINCATTSATTTASSQPPSKPSVDASQPPSNNSIKTVKLKVLPIIYGPTYDPSAKAVGVCIYVGARAPANEPNSNYNWVQKLRTTDINPSCPAAAGNPGYKIDNCNEDPSHPDPSDPKDFPQSDLYRGLNAPAWKGNNISDWLDPQDKKPFDYLFLDIPSRSFDSLFEAANRGGPTFKQHTALIWNAILNPVRVDTQGIASCPVYDKELGKIGVIGPLYCKQAQITYGFKLRRAPSSVSKIRNLEVDLDPLVVDGVEMAPAGNYILSVSDTAYSFTNKQPGGSLPMTYGSATGRTTPVCQRTHVPKTEQGWRVPPQQEPPEFKKLFSP